MIDEQTKIITDAMAVWGWHLLAFMFFLRAVSFLIANMYFWGFGLMGVFVICEIVALWKKWGLENEN